MYYENGQLRPFQAVIETPRGPNTVAIRNIGQIEFPIAASVIADDVDTPSAACAASATTVQGGALRTYGFDPSVDSVEVLLKTDGRPLNARVELLQGPNNNKQVIALYTEAHPPTAATARSSACSWSASCCGSCSWRGGS